MNKSIRISSKTSAIFFSIFILAGILSVSPFARAERVMNNPPMTQRSVHGGVIGTQICITADMLDASNYGAIAIGGVNEVLQTYRINIKNLSGTAQHTFIDVLPGTQIYTQNSRGGAVPVPDTNGPTKSVDSIKTIAVGGAGGIAPYDSAMIEFAFQSSSTQTAITPFDPDIVCGSQTPNVCLLQDSTLNFRIRVAEDRGAIVAHAVSYAHRCTGVVDHYLQPPMALQINGGRAF